MAEIAVVIGAVIVATAAWAYLFLLDRDDIWPRTWVAAAVLSAYSLATLAALGRLDTVVGPVTLAEVGIGLGVGGAWLVATHVGHAVLCRLFPAFVAQIRDLYQLGEGDRVRRLVGPVVAMGVAEELLFRGVVQSVAGFAVGVAVYTAVQLVERKWALVLAALLGGLVWGGLFAWRGGIIAPVAAHVLWTTMLTFVWRLNGCDADRTLAKTTSAGTGHDRGGPRAVGDQRSASSAGRRS